MSKNKVHLTVDGAPLIADEGRSVASALMAAGIYRFRASPNGGLPRGAFCMIGICQECVVTIDGEVRQACQVAVRDGLSIGLKGPYES